jgi:hypothetical protein
MEKETDRRNDRLSLRHEFVEVFKRLFGDKATVGGVTADMIKWLVGAFIAIGITSGLFGGILYFIELQRQHLYK